MIASTKTKTLKYCYWMRKIGGKMICGNLLERAIAPAHKPQFACKFYWINKRNLCRLCKYVRNTTTNGIWNARLTLVNLRNFYTCINYIKLSNWKHLLIFIVFWTFYERYMQAFWHAYIKMQRILIRCACTPVQCDP